ncbi:MAG: type II toxin-antitoxin system RelE/ParE family toxin [Verrucomicrobia bacterium]|nr:type II toxin-antitoxin system RelE/ParE family toxin [Verrucomicrobiota bacterium]
MEVLWSARASEDIERIYWRIRASNPVAAREVVQTLYDGCSALREFPNRGRVGRMKGRRELVFPSLPYIVVYQFKEHAVEISRIYHGAQDWP